MRRPPRRGVDLFSGATSSRIFQTISGQPFGGSCVKLKPAVASRSRRYRMPGLIIPALAISVTAQSAVVIGYELTRPIPNPILTIRLDDALRMAPR